MKSSTLFFSTCFLSLFACTVFTSTVFTSTAFAQGLTLTGVQPSAGAPGDQVRLQGTGFRPPAQAYLAVGFDGVHGFALQVHKKARRTGLTARVVETHIAVEGPVVLWQGRRTPLPKRRFGGGTFKIREGYTFTANKSATGPNFQARTGSTHGLSSSFVGGEIHLDVGAARPTARSASVQETSPETDPDKPPPLIEWGLGNTDAIAVMLAGSSCGEEDEQDSESPFTAGRYRAFCVQGACIVNPTVLADSINTTLGPSGFQARVVGTKVVVGHESTLCSGFMDVSLAMSEAPAAASKTAHNRAVISR